MALIDPQHTYAKQVKPTPEALVRTHMQLVRRIAWHVHARVASAIDVEDLAQIGMVALVESANSFEDRGHAFATYATLRIRGAMIDHLRRHATICRAAIQRRRELTQVRTPAGEPAGPRRERGGDGRGNGARRRRLSRVGRRQPGGAAGIDRRGLFRPFDVVRRRRGAGRRGDRPDAGCSARSPKRSPPCPSARRWCCSSISSRR